MSTSQLFKENIPIVNLFTLLDSICVKYENHYEINNIAFKKGMFNNLIQTFFNDCKPFYRKSKLKYLERPINYNSFITVVRQICNANSIVYKSNIKYDKTQYDIYYYIYFNTDASCP